MKQDAKDLIKAIVAKKVDPFPYGIQRADVDIVTEENGRVEGYRNGACFANLAATINAKANRRDRVTHIIYLPIKESFTWFSQDELLAWFSGCHKAGMLRPFVGPPEDILYRKEFIVPLRSYDASYDRIYVALSSVRYMAEYGGVVRHTVALNRLGVPFLLAFFISHSALMIGSGHSFLNVTGGGYGNRASCYDLGYYMKLRDYLSRRNKWAVAGTNLAPLVLDNKTGQFKASQLLDEECKSTAKNKDSLDMGSYEKMISDEAIMASNAATIAEARVLIGQ